MQVSNLERDKFLTEAMGEYWHEWQNGYTAGSSAFSNRAYSCARCTKTGEGHVHLGYLHPDFSTWPGFGKLWEWAQRQEWIEDLVLSLTMTADSDFIPRITVHPDRFANAVYAFLKDRKVK